MKSYLLLVAGWTVYFFIHSFLAANSVKEFLFARLHGIQQAYRISYVVISTIGLGLLVYFSSTISDTPIISASNLSNVGYLIAIVGVVFIVQSFKHYSLSGFLGISEEMGDLRIEGLLQRVRHPIYTGTILITIGYWCMDSTYSTTVSVACIWIYLGIGIQLEEKKLIKTFGDRYRQYKKDVPMLIPRLWN